MQGRFKMEYRLFTIVRYNYNYRDYNKPSPPFGGSLHGRSHNSLHNLTLNNTLVLFTLLSRVISSSMTLHDHDVECWIQIHGQNSVALPFVSHTDPHLVVVHIWTQRQLTRNVCNQSKLTSIHHWPMFTAHCTCTSSCIVSQLDQVKTHLLHVVIPIVIVIPYYSK